MADLLGTAITGYAYFVSGLTGKTGLTVTIYVNAPGGSNLISAGSASAIDATNQPGLYSYTLAASNVTTLGFYTFNFRTTDTTVNQQQLQAIVEVRAPTGALYAGTASAGGGNTITLAGGVATDNLYKYCLVEILAGTGIGQSRLIIDYVGSTKVATVQKSWTTNPDSTSVFAVMPFAIPAVVHSGIAQAGAASTITLQSIASSTDNLYNGLTISIFSGTGVAQARTIKSYVGSTKVATLNAAWATNPDSTSVYEISALGPAWADVYQWTGTAVATPNTAGVPVVDLARILGALLTETVPGYIAAGVKKFFNVVTPTSTMNQITLVDTTTNLTNGAPSASTVAAAVWAYLTSAIATPGSIGEYILAKLGLLGVIVNSISAQVQTGGLTEITEGSSYLAANSPANPLVYTISGLPLPTLSSAAYWHGSNKTGGSLKVPGTVSAVDSLLGTFDLTFDLTAAQSAKLKSGNYSLHLLSSSSNALVVPNDTLIVNEAI